MELKTLDKEKILYNLLNIKENKVDLKMLTEWIKDEGIDQVYKEVIDIKGEDKHKHVLRMLGYESNDS